MWSTSETFSALVSAAHAPQLCALLVHGLGCDHIPPRTNAPLIGVFELKTRWHGFGLVDLIRLVLKVHRNAGGRVWKYVRA